MELESSNKCEYDHLSIYNGASYTSPVMKVGHQFSHIQDWEISDLVIYMFSLWLPMACVFWINDSHNPYPDFWLYWLQKETSLLSHAPEFISVVIILYDVVFGVVIVLFGIAFDVVLVVVFGVVETLRSG